MMDVIAGNSGGKDGGSASTQTEDDFWCLNWSRSSNSSHWGTKNAFHLKPLEKMGNFISLLLLVIPIAFLILEIKYFEALQTWIALSQQWTSEDDGLRYYSFDFEPTNLCFFYLNSLDWVMKDVIDVLAMLVRIYWCLDNLEVRI